MSANGAGAAVGADVHLGPLELMAGIAADMSTSATKIDKALGKINPLPLRIPFVASGISTGASPMIVAIMQDFPSPGHMWYVQRVGIFGSDGHTQVAGAIADIYTGPGEQNTGVDFASQIYSGLNVPTIVNEGRYRNPMSPNDIVYALVYNVPANQQIVLAAVIADYLLESQERMWQ